MTVQPCNTCGTLKPTELLAKNAEALQCVSCYTGKKKTTRKERATLILLINQINCACEEEGSESHIHELAWQLVNATRPKDGERKQ